MIYMPYFCTRFLYQNKDNLYDTDLKEKYGSFYQFLRRSATAPEEVNWQPAIFMLQRTQISIIFVLLPKMINENILWTQLTIYVYSLLTTAMFTASVNPFADKLLYYVENLNNVGLLTLGYLVFCCSSGLVNDAAQQYLIG